MAYLVQAGSLTIVARSPSEAVRIRERLLNDAAPDVLIMDMDGNPQDIDRLHKIIRDIDMH